jgi:predicted metal-dependent hydrolase
MEAGEPEKRFYQGILQIAVALYHLGNHNWRGAVILLGEGINRLSYYQPSYAGIAVEDLLGQTAQLLSALQQAGPEKVAEFVPLVRRYRSCRLAIAANYQSTKKLNKG